MQDQQEAESTEEIGPLREVVAKGVRYAARRFPESEALQNLLDSAEISASPTLGRPVDVIPPAKAGDAARVLFNPAYIAGMRREHRFPEWVICASVERLVLALTPRWPLAEPDVSKLAAHRERARRAPSSGAGPQSNP